MPFIELHFAHNARPVLFNAANISSICNWPEGNGTSLTIDGEECYIVKEPYEQVKAMILQAEKA